MNTNSRISDAVAESANATQRAYGDAASAWRDGMARAAGGFGNGAFGNTEANFKDRFENARRTTENWVQFCQGNIEAFVRSGQIWASGVQDLSKQAAASAQGSLEEAVSSAHKLGSARSLKDAVEIQTTLARSLVERAVAEAGHFADASVKLAEQAIAPIAARLTLATEKFAKSA